MSQWRVAERNDGKFLVQKNVGIGFSPDRWVSLKDTFNTKAEAIAAYKKIKAAENAVKIKRVINPD